MKELRLILFLCVCVCTQVFGVISPRYAWAADKRYNIGVIAPLTGHMATIGSAVINGIELARADRPELFSNIRYTYEDDQYEATQSITAYKKLREIDGVSLVFGFGVTLGLVVGPMAERDGIPLINFNFDATSAIGRESLVRSMNHTGQYMQALADYFAKQGDSQFNLIHTESQFLNSMVTSFTRAVGDRAKVDVLASYNPSDTDFRAVILRLRSIARADRARPIGIFLAPEQLIEFLKQARALHLEGEYFGTDLFETAAVIAPDDLNLQGCLYPDNQVSESFRVHYRERYGSEAQMTFAGSAYEMAILIGELVSDTRTINSHSLLSAFSSVQNRNSVLGEYSFVNDKDFGKFFQFPVYVKRITGTVGVPVS